MAARHYSPFAERKVTSPSKGAPPGKDGVPGDEAKGRAIGEKTAAWPDPTPHWKGSFNRATRVPVVKTRARKGGID